KRGLSACKTVLYVEGKDADFTVQGPFIPSATWQPLASVPEAHGFASPPHSEFARSRMKRFDHGMPIMTERRVPNAACIFNRVRNNPRSRISGSQILARHF